MPRAARRRRRFLDQISYLKQQNILLSQRLDRLEAWKNHLYNIYDIEEVLEWRGRITKWDVLIELCTPKERIHKCLINLTKWPTDVIALVEQYSG